MHLIASTLMGLFFLPSISVLNSPTVGVHFPVQTVASTVSVNKKIPSKPKLNVTVTSYNAVPEQTDGSPFITASGAYSNPEVVAARSRDLAKKLPFGTVVMVSLNEKSSPTCGYGLVKKQIGYRVIADTMNASKHKQVDILLDQRNTVRVGKRALNPSIALGVCKNMTIRVVGHIKIAYIPHTQDELARKIMENASTLALR